MGNFIGDMYWNFHEDDIIIVTLIVQSLSVQYFPHQFPFTTHLLNILKKNKKNAQVRQTNFFRV